MRYKSFLTMPTLAIALGLGGAALAAPAGTVKDVGAGESMVIKVHACHRSCERRPGGWHRHVGLSCTRVACSPKAWFPNRCFVDRWGHRHCRW